MFPRSPFPSLVTVEGQGGGGIPRVVRDPASESCGYCSLMCLRVEAIRQFGGRDFEALGGALTPQDLYA